jgi:2-hydroxychromene-2-carboxylate isomerase
MPTPMTEPDPKSLSRIARDTGLDRRELRVLVHDHGIRWSRMLGAVVIHDDDLPRLREIVAAYQAKVAGRPAGRRRVPSVERP